MAETVAAITTTALLLGLVAMSMRVNAEWQRVCREHPEEARAAVERRLGIKGGDR